MEETLFGYAITLTSILCVLRFVIHELVDTWRWFKRL